MREDIKERWVDALESGQYKQGYGSLNKEGKLCCLGVLCEIAVQDGVVTGRNTTIPSKSIGYVSTSENRPPNWVDHDILPEAVRVWADLKERNPNVSFDGQKTVISEINDTYRLTFPEIANLIKDQL